MKQKLKKDPINYFNDGLKLHLQNIWKRRKNPLEPDKKAEYPGRITNFAYVEIDGKKRLFRIVINEVKE